MVRKFQILFFLFPSGLRCYIVIRKLFFFYQLNAAHPFSFFLLALVIKHCVFICCSTFTRTTTSRASSAARQTLNGHTQQKPKIKERRKETASAVTHWLNCVIFFSGLHRRSTESFSSLHLSPLVPLLLNIASLILAAFVKRLVLPLRFNCEIATLQQQLCVLCSSISFLLNNSRAVSSWSENPPASVYWHHGQRARS